MTLDAFRALCADDRTGWVARAVGRAPETLRKWLGGRALSGASGPWLANLHAITPAPTPERPHRVLIDVDVRPGPERTA